MSGFCPRRSDVQRSDVWTIHPYRIAQAVRAEHRTTHLGRANAYPTQPNKNFRVDLNNLRENCQKRGTFRT